MASSSDRVREAFGELAAQDTYGSMPLSANIEDRRNEPLDYGMAEFRSRYRPKPLPRLPVQIDDPLAVAAGYNWIGQRPPDGRQAGY